MTEIELIINAETEAEKIVNDAKDKAIMMLKDVDIKSKQLKAEKAEELKNYTKDMNQKAEISAKEKYENILKSTKSQLEVSKNHLNQRTSELAQKITKEIVEKWL